MRKREVVETRVRKLQPYYDSIEKIRKIENFILSHDNITIKMLEDFCNNNKIHHFSDEIALCDCYPFCVHIPYCSDTIDREQKNHLQINKMEVLNGCVNGKIEYRKWLNKQIKKVKSIMEEYKDYI